MEHSAYEHPWNWGQPRGGTNAVLVDGLYYAFFHSSVDRRGVGLVYYVGCYAFEPERPFRVVAMSQAPLCAGDAPVLTCGGVKAVVFPSGAILREGVWTVAAGYNDRACKLFQIDHSSLVRGLKWRGSPAPMASAEGEDS
jgi:predicted GH43/DUF377 family glycosyl hydrolase